MSLLPAMARAPRRAAARLGRNSPCLVFLLLLLAQHACLVAGQAWRVLPAGYGAASSPPPAPSPRRLGGMPRSGAGSSEEGAAMPVPAQSAVTSGGAVGGAFTSAALPVKPTPAAAVLPAAAAVSAVTQPRARATPAAVTPPVDNDALSSSDAVYAPIATLPPQTTTVREANGDTVSTTKTVTEEVPLSRLTAGLFQQAAAAKGGVARAAVPSTTTEATSDVPRGGGVERIIERVPVPVPVPVPVKAPATVAAKASPAKKPPPPVAAAASPPPPPPPVTAELTNVPTPLDLVQAHQAAMQAVGGGRFIVNRTALEEALSGTAVAPTPATTSSHSGSSKGPTRASGHTSAKAPPAKKAAPAPQEKVARRHGFAYWAGLWFLLLLMCLCVSVLARGSRGGPVFAPNMWGHASQAAQDGLKWVSTSAGAYGSTSSQAPSGRASAPVKASSERVRGERDKRGPPHGKGKHHHSSKGDKRRGGKEDDLAPEEYMMTSLRSDRSAASAPSSDAGGVERRQVDLGGHRSAPSLTASGGSAAPPWEQLHRDAPSVATTPAVDVLKAMGKGKKGTQVARSWVPGDAAGRPQLKCLVQADKEGVFVAWQESRLGPSQRVQVHSVLGALDTLTVTLDTASGDMKVHPADVEGRALWVLGLNAAFHAHSAALAAATRGDWDVSAAELEAAVIGLPWHPAVYLAASQGAMATAAPAAEAVQPPSSGRHRGHPVAPPHPSLRDDGRMLDAL